MSLTVLQIQKNKETQLPKFKRERLEKHRTFSLKSKRYIPNYYEVLYE